MIQRIIVGFLQVFGVCYAVFCVVNLLQVGTQAQVGIQGPQRALLVLFLVGMTLVGLCCWLRIINSVNRSLTRKRKH